MEDKRASLVATIIVAIGFIILVILAWWLIRSGHYARYCNSPWMSYTSQCRSFHLLSR